MRQLIGWLRQRQFFRAFSRVMAIGLMTVSLLLAPAFILQSTVQAQAASDAPDAPEKRLRIIQAEPNEVDPISPDILKRIRRGAENLGDKARQSAGDSGKKVRKLSDNASETANSVKKQRFGRGSKAEPETKGGYFKRG